MKVFGIGLSKTGTSSLANALTMLDYNVKDCLGVEKYIKGDITSIDENALLNYNALTDTPIPSFYQELDAKYPGSKFILTIRDMDGWLKSCKKQFNQKSADKQSEAHNELFLDLYATTVFDEDKFRQNYLRFVDEVKVYFKDRPNDLLILDLINGDGWEKLCLFLNQPIPDVPFPKTNVTQIRWLNIHELAQSVRSSAMQMHKLSQNLAANETSSINKISNIISSLLGLEATGRIDSSANKTQKLIEKELRRLNSSIPLISKSHHDTTLETRGSWNHFWLISSTEGSSQLNNGGIGYSINVALIEDGLPFLGIIYIPSLDTLYYAALDKGAYKIQGNNAPVKIKSQRDLANSLNKETKNITTTSLSSSQGIGDILCQSIEKNILSSFSIASSKEWQTAAGHAILKTIGITLIDTTSNAELKYNKESWNNTPIIINTQ